MHLDDERIERLLDQELTATEADAARDHLAACPDCRRLFEAARREQAETEALLRHLDDAAPRVAADAVARRAVARATSARHFRRAAGIVVALGVAGATYVVYATPGSPLRAWTTAAARWVGDHLDGPGPSEVQSGDSGPAIAGIAVSPGRSLLIQFIAPRDSGQVHMVLTDRSDVAVRAPAGAATFTSGLEHLLIDNRGLPADFEIEIPRTAPRIEIRVAGSRVFLKEGSRIVTEAHMDVGGRYVASLASR